MRKSFFKLTICNLILCLEIMALFGVSEYYYAIRDDNPGISENDSENINDSAECDDFKAPDIVSDNKIDANENHSDPQEKPDDSEPHSQNTKKSSENTKNKEIKPAKKKTNPPKPQNEEKNIKQVILPEISFEDLDLGNSEKTENFKKTDNSDKILKGAISLGLVLLGISLIIFVVADNRKIPDNADIKTRNKHDAKHKREKKCS
jgi:hypothetical protein